MTTRYAYRVFRCESLHEISARCGDCDRQVPDGHKLVAEGDSGVSDAMCNVCVLKYEVNAEPKESTLKIEHFREILDLANIDEQEQVIRDYRPTVAVRRMQSVLAIQVDGPWREASAVLANFFTSMGSVASLYSDRDLESEGIVEQVEVDSFGEWEFDIFPLYGIGRDRVVFFFPNAKIEE